jgi:hypothetical protein
MLYISGSVMRADETPAAELWNRTVVQIPSVFGRLAYLASLRDPNSGQYQHFGFSQRFSEREADKTIRRSHSNIFTDWLCFSLEQQRGDLEIYLDSAEADRRTILANWREWPPYMNWIPTQTRTADRELFQSDLEIVLDLIRRDSGDASTGRIA